MTADRPRPSSNTLSTDGRSQAASSALTFLMIDDNFHVADSLAVAIRLAGHAMDHAAGPEEALSRLAVRRYDAILLDMNYAAGRTDGEEGLALLARILADDGAARVVVITAHSGIRIAVEAMRGGARDFVMKPWRNADLLARLERVATAATQVAPAEMPAQSEPARLIGECDAIVRVRDLIRRVAPTMAGVVVTGLAGTGRSLVAGAIHAGSPYADRPMTRVDLRDPSAWARIGETTGTLLLRHPDRLDEVEQSRLCDLLPDTARIVAIADNAASILPSLARRVATVEIAVPPLATRGDDALLLARHFIRTAAERHRRPEPSLTPAAQAVVLDTAWPDQVRSLAAAMERAVLLGDGETIDTALLLPPAPPTIAAPAAPSRFDLERNERAVIEAALREHHHNVTHAATALGLSRGALYRRMERHGL